jgi:DNA invertase Pin-like site-specific DNA recombinase
MHKQGAQMKVGYARTSTMEQVAGFEAQVRDLEAAGVEKLFKEQLSSVDAQRAQLEAALEFIREGDVLVVTKIDRLARSVANLVDIERRLHVKGASLQVLDPGLDTGSSIGRLVFNMIAAIAQFEREIMLERQREGIAKAKAEGKYKGRQRLPQEKVDEAVQMLRAGVGATDVAQKLSISRRSVYNIAKEHGADAAVADAAVLGACPATEQ